MKPEAAARDAARRFGNPLRLREESLDVKLLPSIESLGRDVRLAVRMLTKNAGVTTAALISRSLALGAWVAAFALVDALISRLPGDPRRPRDRASIRLNQLGIWKFGNLEIWKFGNLEMRKCGNAEIQNDVRQSCRNDDGAGARRRHIARRAVTRGKGGSAVRHLGRRTQAGAVRLTFEGTVAKDRASGRVSGEASREFKLSKVDKPK